MATAGKSHRWWPAAVAGVFVLAALALAAPASAQEAGICTKWNDHLKPQNGPYNLGNDKDSVIGTDDKDRIFAEGGNDLINGGRGSDHVDGGEGDDTLCGGRGNDVIDGGPGHDVIFGEEENDTIDPGPDNDRVLGSEGDDKIIGYGGKPGSIVDDGIDLLDGGFNNDIIIAGGADTLLGFTHNDKLSTKTPDVAPKLMDGGGNDDKITGSNKNDKIRGGENGIDVLKGKDGNDDIAGEGNNDDLFGEDGDDHLDGGDGKDNLNGGPGDDVCIGGPLVDRASQCEEERSIPRVVPRFGF